MKMNTDSSQRKDDHLELVSASIVEKSQKDHRFFYEPLFGKHPRKKDLNNCWRIPFLNYQLKAPLWISSMTGGSEKGRLINIRLARAAKKFGLGMALGSCRSILHEGKIREERFEDFHVRSHLGDNLPLMANIGIAQIEELLNKKEEGLVENLLSSLQADGLIIHLNPMQEWFQTEGDRYDKTPFETLKEFSAKATYPLIFKEVGQGIGPKSLKALIELRPYAIEFASLGGTNFSKLESLRSSKEQDPLLFVGHDIAEMISFVKKSYPQEEERKNLPLFIASGGIVNFLDGAYYLQQLPTLNLYGMAGQLAKRAASSEEELFDYIERELLSLMMSSQFLEKKIIE